MAAPVRKLGRWHLEPVLVQRMRPSVPIDPGASMVHGIYSHHLRDAPTFHEVAERVR
jgi:DNA polymerase III epsilon subunit-like protein